MAIGAGARYAGVSLPITMRIFIFALLSLTLSAAADVVIYKGTATAKTQTSIDQYSKTPRVYYIVDLATRESFPIFYYTIAGQKNQSISLPLTPTRYTSGAGPKGKAFGAFSFVFDDAGMSSYSNVVIYLRGTEKPVAISSAKMGNFPKTMTGVFRAAGKSGGGGSFLHEVNLVLAYDEFHTQTANNQAKSGQAMYTQIKAELEAKGF